MKQNYNSIYVWKKILRKREEINSDKRKICSITWVELFRKFQQESLVEIVNCILNEYKESKDSCIFTYIVDELQSKSKVEYSLYVIIRNVYYKVINKSMSFEWNQNFLNQECYCNNEEKKEMWHFIEKLKKENSLGIKFNKMGQEQEENLLTLKKDIKCFQDMNANLAKQLKIEKERNVELKNQITSLEQQLECMSKERKNEKLEVEFEYKKKSEEKEEELKKIKQEKILRFNEQLEEEKEKILKKFKKELINQEIEKENNKYLEEVKKDIKRREIFEDNLCDTLRDVSREVKRNTSQIMGEFINYQSKVVEEIEKEMKNVINIVVDTERKIQCDDYEELIRNFCDLQKILYYNKTDEQELGLQATKIERYSRRFLKTLNRLGFEHYIPTQNDIYDEDIHEIVEDENDDFYVLEEDLKNQMYIADVVSYGFKRNGEVCIKAQVTLKKREI